MTEVDKELDEILDKLGTEVSKHPRGQGPAMAYHNAKAQLKRWNAKEKIKELENIYVPIEKDDDDIVLDMKAHTIWSHLKKRIAQLQREIKS